MLALLVGPASAQRTSPLALSTLHKREQAQYRASAPGDAYFGRLKMSYLGINNVFKDQTVRAGERTVDPQIINKLKDADESLRAWAKSYPRDPELARTYFLAITAYKKVWTKEYQEKAWQYMHVVVDKFPLNYFGKQVKKDLAIGFTERYYADALPCPLATPNDVASPQPEATPSAVRKRGAKATPAPTEMPTPEPTPSSTPSPAPAASPAPGQPKVEVVVAPCVAPAPPSAEPVVAPAGASSPAATSLPTATLSPVPSAPSATATPSPAASRRP